MCKLLCCLSNVHLKLLNQCNSTCAPSRCSVQCRPTVAGSEWVECETDQTSVCTKPCAPSAVTASYCKCSPLGSTAQIPEPHTRLCRALIQALYVKHCLSYSVQAACAPFYYTNMLNNLWPFLIYCFIWCLLPLAADTPLSLRQETDRRRQPTVNWRWRFWSAGAHGSAGALLNTASPPRS